jgi:hypothetical protein
MEEHPFIKEGGINIFPETRMLFCTRKNTSGEAKYLYKLDM